MAQGEIPFVGLDGDGDIAAALNRLDAELMDLEFTSDRVLAVMSPILVPPSNKVYQECIGVTASVAGVSLLSVIIDSVRYRVSAIRQEMIDILARQQICQGTLLQERENRSTVENAPQLRG